MLTGPRALRIIGSVLLGWGLLVMFSTPKAAQAAAPIPTDPVTVAAGGQARASIVLGQGASEVYRFSGTELQRYLRALSGSEIRIISDAEISSRPPQEAAILVGGPSVNKQVRQAASALGMNFTNLRPEGFFIKIGRLGSRPVVVVGGNEGISTLYGVYELVHRLGVTFRLTGDIVPPRRDPLSIPPLDLRREPAMSRRGFLLQDGGYENLTMFSYEDYVRLIDQMAKMQCNYIQFWWFSFEPWLKYSYKGEAMWMGDVSTKESGYLTWAHEGFGSRTTDDVSIGKEHFKGRRIAPPEMQNVESPDQAFDIAQNLLQKIIRHANERGIKVWLAVEMASLPPNLARYCERVGDLPFNRIFGTFVHPLDEVNREIQVSRLRALIETYPEAEGYYLVIPEAYPELNDDKHRTFFEQMRPKFFELRRLRWPWIDWGYQGSADRLVDSNIGYFDLFQYLLKKRDQIAPRAKIGLMGIGRGYTLPLFDKMLSKDIPFTDMESSGVWTPSGVPMEYFGGMGERERTIEPRVDDDVNMMGMQFNVNQYGKTDRIFIDGVKFGLTGFAGQLNRARGTETNSLFLAEAAWSPELTPEEFYKNYSERVFGRAAAPAMYRALMTLEENEAYLGYYNFRYSTMNCCGPLPEVNQAYRYSLQPNPYEGPATPEWPPFIIDAPDVIDRFEGSIRLLNQALGAMHSALPDVAPQGAYELRYMMNRTQSYRDYIESLVTIRRAYLDFDAAFRNRTQVSREQFIKNLEKSLGEFEKAREQVRAATRKYSEIIDHPSDLGVLYHLNARAVLGFDLVGRWMRNVVNFHEGKPYFDHVPFERLFSRDLHLAIGR